MALSTPLFLYDSRDWDGTSALPNHGSAGASWDLPTDPAGDLYSWDEVVGDRQRRAQGPGGVIPGTSFSALGVDVPAAKWTFIGAVRPPANGSFIISLYNSDEPVAYHNFYLNVSLGDATHNGISYNGTGFSWTFEWTTDGGVNGGGVLSRTGSQSGYKTQSLVAITLDPVNDTGHQVVSDGVISTTFNTNTIDAGDAAGYAAVAGVYPFTNGSLWMNSNYDITPPGSPWKTVGFLLATGAPDQSELDAWAAYFGVD
jgi:hypothetical protein